MPFAPSSFLLLVVGPGAPSSVLAPSSDSVLWMNYKCSKYNDQVSAARLAAAAAARGEAIVFKVLL